MIDQTVLMYATATLWLGLALMTVGVLALWWARYAGAGKHRPETMIPVYASHRIDTGQGWAPDMEETSLRRMAEYNYYAYGNHR